MAKRRAPRSVADAGMADTLPRLNLPACVASLGVRHSLFLLAALADASVAGYRYGGVRSRLAPHKGFASQMLSELADRGAITLRVSLELPRLWPPISPAAEDPEWKLSETFATTPDLPVLLLAQAKIAATGLAGADELFTLWRELAISEAAGFLAAELGDHRFDEGWALAAVPAIERGLRQMSVNQMFYFCWMSVRETASRYLRYPASVGTLADGLVTYIDQRVDRALTERWAIREWYGSKRIVSNVAQVFAEQLTDLGGEYMSTVPSRGRVGASPYADPRLKFPGTERRAGTGRWKMGSTL